MKYYGVKEKGFNIHPIRKSFIKSLIDKGVAPQHVQKLARHANFNTTIQHYYDADIDLLRKEMGR